MSYILEQDGMSGKCGKAFATVDGRNVELFGLKKFKTNAEFTKADFPVVGTKVVQQKITGVKNTGSFTIYYGTPEFVDIAYRFQETGTLPEITLQVTNDDPSTTVGTQTLAYYGVNLDNIPLSILDDSADFLEEEVTFTFSRFERMSSFGKPAKLG